MKELVAISRSTNLKLQAGFFGQVYGDLGRRHENNPKEANQESK